MLDKLSKKIIRYMNTAQRDSGLYSREMAGFYRLDHFHHVSHHISSSLNKTAIRAIVSKMTAFLSLEIRMSAI